MKIKVLAFAHLREITGSAEFSLELDEGSSGEDLLNILEDKFPDMKKIRRFLKLSMNGAYIVPKTEITDGSEVAVFPPVSGG
jgi:MoaD family protein